MNKKLKNFRLSPEAVDALLKESERTGKSETAVVEDILLWRRMFGEEAEAALQFMTQKHKLPARKIVEVSLMKAAGIGAALPFEMPLAA